MQKHSFILVLLLIFSSCNNDEKKAQIYLQEAYSCYENASYNSAKTKIDSLKLLYPKQLKVQTEGLHLMRLIELKEQERNLAFCDSMLIIRDKEVEEMKSKFLFEKDPEYDEIGKYYVSSQKPENNLRKSYLRTWVNEDGEMFLASIYYGSSAIKHDHIKVSLADGSFAETEKIPFDGGLNYTFTDFGMVTEVVTYFQRKDNGVIMFIYNHKDQAIKVDYLGGKNYSITLSFADKDALIKTVDFSIILLDMGHLQKEKEKAFHRIEYLKNKK